MKIIKDTLNYNDSQTNVFYFIPDLDQQHQKTFAIFTHGYTADKSSILNWAIRLTEVGVSCAIFDLPGHYLGNYSEVISFNHFKLNAHKLFIAAFNGLSEKYKLAYPQNHEVSSSENFELVLGGHSLGALLALKAIELPEFQNIKKRVLGVGIGMAPLKVVHLFDTPFYKSTLQVREQLVSPELASVNVFPWIKDEKARLSISNHKIHLITGMDDLVVGEDGTERFVLHLKNNKNEVTFEKPNRLPHQEPQLAAGHIKKYFKDQGLLMT